MSPGRARKPCKAWPTNWSTIWRVSSPVRRETWSLEENREAREGMPAPKLTANLSLPADASASALAGRIWRPDQDGPSVVAIRADGVFDISRAFPTMRDLCETEDPAAALRAANGEPLGAPDAIPANTPPDDRDPAKPRLLSPIDLRASTAAGLTFAASSLQRVIAPGARRNP